MAHAETEYWNLLPDRIATLRREIARDAGADPHALRAEAADLIHTLSNRFELAIRQAAARE